MDPDFGSSLCEFEFTIETDLKYLANQTLEYSGVLSVKTPFTGIMVGQANEEHLRMGPNRHRHYARLLRLPRFFLFLHTDGGLANVGAHRSPGRDASSVAGVMHRRFWNSPERRLLYPDRWVYVQPGQLSARHQERRRYPVQASLTMYNLDDGNAFPFFTIFLIYRSILSIQISLTLMIFDFSEM